MLASKCIWFPVLPRITFRIWSSTMLLSSRNYRWKCCSIAADPSLHVRFMVIFWGRNRDRRVAGATKRSFPAPPLLLHGVEWMGVLLLNQIEKKFSPEVEYSGRNLELSTRCDESSARLIEKEMTKMQGNVCVEVFPTIVTMQEKRRWVLLILRIRWASY